MTAATDARIKAEQKLVCVRDVPINEAACKSSFGEGGMDQARAMWTDYHQAATAYSDRNWFGRTLGSAIRPSRIRKSGRKRSRARKPEPAKAKGAQ